MRFRGHGDTGRTRAPRTVAAGTRARPTAPCRTTTPGVPHAESTDAAKRQAKAGLSAPQSERLFNHSLSQAGAGGGGGMSRGRERVVALVDMDCFFMQVEQRLDPQLRGRPCAVVQYTEWQGGGIIAVSYEARAFGVSRGMWASEARALCPELALARVPQARGKADLTRYREASAEVMQVLSRFAAIERASIDEAYLDLTGSARHRLRDLRGRPLPAALLPSTFVQGLPGEPGPDPGGKGAHRADPGGKEELRQRGLDEWLASLSFDNPDCPDLQLTMGAVIVEEIRAAVEEATGFRCSAGISHNKTLAKLACGLNKPNRQTLVSARFVPQLFSKLPVSSVRNLGGKLGTAITDILGVEYIGELTQFSETELQTHFGDKTGSWLYDLCRGIEEEPVKNRYLPQSIGCSKNFPGKLALATQKAVQHWLLQLALELESRLNKDRSQNHRVARQLMVVIRQQGDTRVSRLCALSRYDAQKMCNDAFTLIQNCNMAGAHQAAWSPPLISVQLSASKFSEPVTLSTGITTFLTGDTQPDGTATTSQNTMSCGRARVKFFRSPSKELRQKPASAIESFFQKAAERQLSQAAATTSLSTAATAESVVPTSPEHQERTAVGLPVGPASVQCDLESPVKRSPSDASPTSPYKMLPQEKLPSEATQTPSTPPNSRTLLKLQPAMEGNEQNLPPSPELTLLPPASPGDQQRCEKCGQLVLVWEFPEHMDYHFALELQSSFLEPSPPMASEAAPNAKAVTSRSPAKAKNKPKTPAGSSAKRPKESVTKTLDFFFKPLPP
ncbi:DNA polymerase eta [Catharus ustulatus]|uniref:DNA polymerase eta n=1 Tax=Catharus ustulatus TaxID=91951 RepID=UPI00140B0289|nr:DNA polymerase eta [Catharus ustulatus]